MIDEKKIEEAADKLAEKYYQQPLKDTAIHEGFKAGINWFLDSLWHDAKEEPKQNKPLLVQYAKYGDTYFTTIMYIPENEIPWNDLIIDEGLTKWCYIDDLLKGGK